jgi:hypothetical protein
MYNKIDHKLLYFLHRINLIIAQLFFICSRKDKVNEIRESAFMKANKFYISDGKKKLSDDKELIKDLINICDFTENYEASFLKSTKTVRRKNYWFVQCGFTNQKQCDDLPEELISNLKSSLLKSDIIKVANSFFKCEFSVVNIKSWIFYPLKSNTDGDVQIHYDAGLPKGTLKIMFYKGNFIEQPALTILSENKNEFNVEGKNPLVLFESNKLEHGAPAPKGKPRPTVEMTLLPRFSSDLIFQQAGMHAGVPRNPFKNFTSTSFHFLSS